MAGAPPVFQVPPNDLCDVENLLLLTKQILVEYKPPEPEPEPTSPSILKKRFFGISGAFDKAARAVKNVFASSDSGHKKIEPNTKRSQLLGQLCATQADLEKTLDATRVLWDTLVAQEKLDAREDQKPYFANEVKQWFQDVVVVGLYDECCLHRDKVVTFG